MTIQIIDDYLNDVDDDLAAILAAAENDGDAKATAFADMAKEFLTNQTKEGKYES